MAQPVQSPQQGNGISQGLWETYSYQVGGQINNAALNLAFEVARHDKLSPEKRNALGNDIFEQFEKVSNGEQTLAQLNDWLHSDATRARFAEAGVHQYLDHVFSDEQLTNYNLLNTLTPTMMADGTVQQLRVTFPFSMEGGFKSLADFKTLMGVPESEFADDDFIPTVAPVRRDPDKKVGPGDRAIGLTEPDAKKTLTILGTLLDQQDMESLPAIKAILDKNPQERADLTKITNLANELNGYLVEKDGKLGFNTNNPDKLDEIKDKANELYKLVGGSAAFNAYSINLIDDFKTEQGTIFNSTVMMDQLRDIRKAARNGNVILGEAEQPAPTQQETPRRAEETAPIQPESTTSPILSLVPETGQTRPEMWSKVAAAAYPANTMVKYFPEAAAAVQETGNLPKPSIVVADNPRSQSEVVITV